MKHQDITMKKPIMSTVVNATSHLPSSIAFQPTSHGEKKTIMFRGPALTKSGYGVHARQVLKWLLSRNDADVFVQAMPWGMCPWFVDGFSRRPDDLIRRITESSRPPPGPVDTSYQLQLPNEWDPNLARVNIGMTAAVETDRCSRNWVDACNRMSAIIVPSEFVKRTLNFNNGIRVPIHVIPESFNDAAPEPTHLPDSVPDFNFLVVAQLTHGDPAADRKNIIGTVKAFCDAFKGVDDTGLILKLNGGRYTNLDRLAISRSFKQLLESLREGGKNPPVHLLHGEMTDCEMTGLMQHPKVKALLATSRGEGFGLPTLDAAVNGLPVIATKWSAPVEYLGKGRSIVVDHKLVEVPQSRIDGKIFVPGARWAEPSHVDIVEKLRKFRSMPLKPKQWAEELAVTLRSEYSPDSISSRYEGISALLEGGGDGGGREQFTNKPLVGFNGPIVGLTNLVKLGKHDHVPLHHHVLFHQRDPVPRSTGSQAIR